MPTFEGGARFRREWAKLSPEQRVRFQAMLPDFVGELSVGRFRPGLRLKRVNVRGQIWEISFGPDDRATFEYGPELLPGHRHVIGRRIGSHDIFRDP